MCMCVGDVSDLIICVAVGLSGVCVMCASCVPCGAVTCDQLNQCVSWTMSQLRYNVSGCGQWAG